MKYYVVSDVHGYYSALIKAITDAGFFDEDRPCKLIVCGDLLDRGEEADKLIELMMKLYKEDKLIYILGNHEDLLVQCVHEITRGGIYEIACGMSHHYHNGTWNTLLQISKMTEYEAYNQPNELVRRVINSDFYRRLLSSCVDYFETNKYIFTHGYFPVIMEGAKPYVRYSYLPLWRDADVMMWKRARWLNGMDIACRYHIKEQGKTVVCGHWHTSYGHMTFEHKGTEWGIDADFSPFMADGIIALDACTAATEKVNCIVIED